MDGGRFGTAGVGLTGRSWLQDPLVLLGVVMVLFRGNLESMNRSLWTSVFGQDVMLPRILSSGAYVVAGIIGIGAGVVTAIIGLISG